MISEKIKEYRKERQMSQYDLAKFLGISRSYVGDIERGRIRGTLKLVKLLVDKTGLDYHYWINNNDIDGVESVNLATGKFEEFTATATILDLILSNKSYDKNTKELYPNAFDSLIKVFREELKMKILIYEESIRDSKD